MVPCSLFIFFFKRLVDRTAMQISVTDRWLHSYPCGSNYILLIGMVTYFMGLFSDPGGVYDCFLKITCIMVVSEMIEDVKI